MAWLREDDGFDDDPAILSRCATRTDVLLVVGALTVLKLYCARHLTDGFLPELVVREKLRSRRLLAMLTDPAAGLPLLHRAPTPDDPGESCPCLEGRPWPRGAAWAVHHYLASNPTRAEHDVNRAKLAELRDRELLAAVRRRDRGRCRYCGEQVNAADRRSAHGLVYDHVDPALAAGAANLVVACRGCNSRKGNRTPDAAAMVLLPAPGTDPAPGPDPAPTSGSETDTTTSRAGPGRDGTGTGDAGPAGRREPTGPAPPRPRSVHPDPYRRTAMTGTVPEHHAGLPDDEDWAAAGEQAF